MSFPSRTVAPCTAAASSRFWFVWRACFDVNHAIWLERKQVKKIQRLMKVHADDFCKRLQPKIKLSNVHTTCDAIRCKAKAENAIAFQGLWIFTYPVWCINVGLCSMSHNTCFETLLWPHGEKKSPIHQTMRHRFKPKSKKKSQLLNKVHFCHKRQLFYSTEFFNEWEFWFEKKTLIDFNL